MKLEMERREKIVGSLLLRIGIFYFKFVLIAFGKKMKDASLKKKLLRKRTGFAGEKRGYLKEEAL